MSDRIVLPVDGSPYARWAGEFVCRQLSPDRLRVTLLHVSRPVPAIEAAAADPAAVKRFHAGEAERMLSPFQAMLARREIRFDARSRVGNAGAEIARQADADGAKLVVMGARGVGALHELAFGSTLQRVMADTDVPVLAVRKPSSRRRIRRVLLAVDGSAPSRRAEAALLALRGLVAADFEVIVAHVARPMSLREATALGLGSRQDHYARESDRMLRGPQKRLGEAGFALQAVAGVGDPAATLVELAASHETDLVVIGSHGRGGAKRLVMGSVSRAVLARSEVPVLFAR
jgi:nucleotide-binding universal stress UspA family protein